MKWSILLVGPLPPPFGGMANQLQQLARLLEEEGSRVSIVQVNAPYKPAWAEELKGIRALFRFAPYLANLWRDIGRNDICHVFANSGWSWHLFAAPAIWIASVRRKKVVLHYHGGEAEAFFRKQYRFVVPTLRRCAKVIVPSGFLKEVFLRFGVEADIVPNVVNLKMFSPASVVSDLPKGRFTILVPRNLDPVYDVATAIRAFALVKNDIAEAELFIAGIGAERQKLENLVGELELASSVKFLGKLTNEQMVEVYRIADVTLNPSLADNLPISLLESLAAGVPVVTTNVGGIPYLVEDTVTALLVSPGSESEMKKALLRIYSDSECRRNLIKNGLQSVKRYSWPEVRQNLFDVYSAVA